MKPLIVLALLVAVFTIVSNAWLAPYSMRLLRDYAIKVRTDLIAQVLQPGKFSTPETGLTIHIADRGANGDLLGLMIHDERDKSQAMTYLAEQGRITKQEGDRALLIMRNGHIQRRNGESRNVQIVVFDSYIFDISQFGPKEGARDFKPRERFLDELLNPDMNDKYYKENSGKFRSELHDRLSNPLYPILFVLIVGVHLGYPRTTREGRMQSLVTAFAVAAGLRVFGLAGVNMLTKDWTGAYIVWGVPLIGITVALIMVHYEIRPLSLPNISLNWRSRSKTVGQTS
jgi:lipopolysaccharide export system permease protein